MPPMVWDLGPDDAQAILTAVATSIHAGLAVPRPLTAVIAESAAIAAAGHRAAARRIRRQPERALQRRRRRARSPA